MAMTDTQLWNRIDGMSIDSGNAPLTFSARLARDNGWSAAYSEKAISEYKRFIYLVTIGGEELTPSDQVDQVWHLHMTYTVSYWHDLCRDILGKELHHLPTKGGADEQARFRTQYTRTFLLYEKEFGHPPPATVWPTVEARFRNVERFVRVNKASSWVLRKPSPALSKILALLTVPLFVVACSDDADGYGIWFWLKVALAVFFLYKIFSWLDSGRGGGGSGGSGCGGCAGCGGCGGD